MCYTTIMYSACLAQLSSYGFPVGAVSHQVRFLIPTQLRQFSQSENVMSTYCIPRMASQFFHSMTHDSMSFTKIESSKPVSKSDKKL